MRKEIEVKARVSDLEGLARKLEALGCTFSEPVYQHDVAYVDESYGDFGAFHPGKNLLRIRESRGKHIFTIKQPQSNELDRIEYETEIEDPEALKKTLELMGYHPVIGLHKTRRFATHQNWTISLDKIDELGTFVELEAITNEANAEKVQDEMWGFLKSFDIPESDRVTKGYDTLAYLKRKGKS
jgi:adenylate cyclase class 2